MKGREKNSQKKMLVLQCMYDDFKKTWSVKLLRYSYKVYLGELKQILMREKSQVHILRDDTRLEEREKTSGQSRY